MTEPTNTDRVEPVGALTITPDQTYWNDQQLAALDSLGYGAAPRADKLLFLQRCQSTNLDPWSRKIYMMGRRSKVNQDGQWVWVTKWGIETGITGFYTVAERSGRYQGMTMVEWCGMDGVWRDVWLGSEPPAAARVGVHKKGFVEPLYGVAVFREYAPRDNNGNLTRMWKSLSSHMLAKVAKAIALREAFPDDLAGLYTSEEMEQANNRTPAVAPEPAPNQKKHPQKRTSSAPQGRSDDREPAKLGKVAEQVVSQIPHPSDTQTKTEPATESDSTPAGDLSPAEIEGLITESASSIEDEMEKGGLSGERLRQINSELEEIGVSSKETLGEHHEVTNGIRTLHTRAVRAWRAETETAGTVNAA